MVTEINFDGKERYRIPIIYAFYLIQKRYLKRKVKEGLF